MRNQALVTGSNVPPTVTDDPLTPVIDDPTGTHVGSQIALDAFKEAQLLDDADNNSQPSAGDTLLYRVTILNKGNVNAPSVTFTDTPDANTTLVVGSVKTTQGAVITGNNGGDTSVAVDVGDMAAQQVVVVTFHVRINTPLPDTVKEVANQGIVDSPSDNCDTPTGDCTTPTDDPTTPAVDDPTITPLIEPPSLVVSKQLSSSPQVKIGDLLTYTIRITNTGRTIITRLPLTDSYSVDYLKYVSAVPAADTVDVNNGVARWDDLTTFFGDLLPGEAFTVTTVMMALGATPDGVQASNRATVIAVEDEFDQPGGSGEDGFDIVVAPNLILTKSRLGPAQVEVGEEITYSIRITNVGNTVIVTLPLSDSYDSQVLNYVRSQPAEDRARPGLVEWFDLTTTFNDLQPNASIEVLTVFTASQAVSNTVNLAQVIDAIDDLGNNVSTEDSDTVTVATPTAVTLLSFAATPEGNALRVSWVTGAEIDSWGFHLWRSLSARRDEAVRVTEQLIPARGSAA
ncbi:MAG: DUF11 domain-containing protein, partial [Caldilineaceae bacterium]|nr:DUF11 domain-containing protein [Caldilineaceae bacterium]